jgi:hypothetical protein
MGDDLAASESKGNHDSGRSTDPCDTRFMKMTICLSEMRSFGLNAKYNMGSVKLRVNLP